MIYCWYHCDIFTMVFSARQYRTMQSALYAIARPSVCLSHGWISQNGWT